MNHKLLVLLAGQSNMSGRGYLTQEDITEIPGLTAIRRDFKWIPAVDPFNYDRLNMLGLVDSRDPFEEKGLTIGDRRRAGVGPGRTFGKYMKQFFPEYEIGLIPASIGGTPIAAWLPGGKDPYSEAHPYDDSLKLAREAMKSGRIAAVLWHQGETDASQQTPGYKDKLKQVVMNFRKDLDLPEVPFILGELGSFLNPSWPVAEYNRMIREVSEELPHTGWVPTSDLADRGDRLHFSAESQHELGRRYWEEFRRLSAI